MSYSLFVRGTSLAAAIAALAIEFDEKVVAAQPVHAADRNPVLVAAQAFGSLLGKDSDTTDVEFAVNGHLQWPNEEAAPTEFTVAGFTVNAHRVKRVTIDV